MMNTEYQERLFNTIRDEHRIAANTAKRVGEALLSLLPLIRAALSRVDDDTAEGVIGFLKGLWVKDAAHGIDADANAVLEGLDVRGAAHFGSDAQFQDVVTFLSSLSSSDFVAGLYTGHGWGIGADGSAQFSRIVTQSMEVLELIVNRLRAWEGDLVLTENDKVVAVERLKDASGKETDMWRLWLDDKWDGYLTAQYEGNILKGVVNTLPGSSAGVSSVTDAETTQSDGRNTYYTSWMWVESVNAESGSNYVDVHLYPDSSVDGGKNFPPCALMSLARWGNVGDSAEQKRRQSFLMLSADGGIRHFVGVTKPRTETYNYGSVSHGDLPEFIKELPVVAERYKEGRDYAWFQGLVYSQLIQVTTDGKPVFQIVHRGSWQDGTPYYYEDWNDDAGRYETSEVNHKGCKWRCLVSQPRTDNGTAVYDEPGFLSPSWMFVEGYGEWHIEFDAPLLVWVDDVAVSVAARVMCGYSDMTAEVLARGGAVVRWTRQSGADGTTVADDELWTPVVADGEPNVLLIDHSQAAGRRRDCGPLWEKQLSCRFTIEVTVPGVGSVTETMNVGS